MDEQGRDGGRGRREWWKSGLARSQEAPPNCSIGLSPRSSPDERLLFALLPGRTFFHRNRFTTIHPEQSSFKGFATVAKRRRFPGSTQAQVLVFTRSAICLQDPAPPHDLLPHPDLRDFPPRAQSVRQYHHVGRSNTIHQVTTADRVRQQARVPSAVISTR